MRVDLDLIVLICWGSLAFLWMVKVRTPEHHHIVKFLRSFLESDNWFFRSIMEKCWLGWRGRAHDPWRALLVWHLLSLCHAHLEGRVVKEAHVNNVCHCRCHNAAAEVGLFSHVDDVTSTAAE